ncbi:MAG: penicillin acylase family protein [bacterium]
MRDPANRPPPRRALRFTMRIVGASLAVAAVALAFPEAWLAGPPARDERIAIGETVAPVYVRRDPYGIAHVAATDESDVWAGLGFAQAHDRACQVEMLVRVAEGTLSEWLGDLPLGAGLDAVSLDRLARELRLVERADRAWQSADPETRRELERFAAGANARLTHLEAHWPACFRVLAVRPRPWRPRDPLLLLELFGLVGQVPSLRAEAVALDLVAALGRERAFALLPPEILVDLADPVISRAAHPSPALVPLAALSPLSDSMLGSNAWVVDGRRSRSGAPLLAADPHVILDRAPTFWYLAHVAAGTIDAQGLFLPGTPLLAVGHSRRLAWGATSTLLRTGGVQQVAESSVVDDAAPSPPIVPRFGSAVEVTRRTVRGAPVLAAEAVGLDPGTALRVDLGATDAARQLRGFRALIDAHDVAATDSAAAALRAGPLSWTLMLADTQGHIARRAAAPIAGGADPYALLDPPEARIVAANTAPPAAPGSSPRPGHFELGYRAARITEALDARPRHGAEDFRRLQLDVATGLASELLPALLADLAGRSELAVARAALASWDGRCERESPGCALFELTQEALPRCAFADELGSDRWQRFASVGDLPTKALLRIWPDAASPWWDDLATPARETRGDCVAQAVAEARAELTAEGGDEPDGWNWGAFHVVRIANPLALLPILGHRFEVGPYAHPGDRYTVNAAGYVRRSDGTRLATLGPTSRFVIDLAQPELGYFASSTGMSEDPFSGYAWNLTDPWLAGELFVESLNGPREVRATVVLEPSTTPHRE